MFGIKKTKDYKESDSRKYFEVFGDTINQLNFFKMLVLFLASIAVFQTIIISTSLKKPPLVIRVDHLGNAQAVNDLRSLQNVTAPEISNFIQHFLEYFTEWNFYTYDDDFTKAFKMMTLPCQQKMNEYLKAMDILSNIKDNQLKVKLNISEILILKDTPEFISLKVKGFKELRSYQNPEFYKEIVFEDELSLRKTERTNKHPWGILVDSWTESLFKGK